jgi:hypothetical protein
VYKLVLVKAYHADKWRQGQEGALGPVRWLDSLLYLHGCRQNVGLSPSSWLVSTTWQNLKQQTFECPLNTLMNYDTHTHCNKFTLRKSLTVVSRGVNKFFQTLTKLANSKECLLAKSKNNSGSEEGESVRGMLASGFLFLLAKPELTRGYPHPCELHTIIQSRLSYITT